MSRGKRCHSESGAILIIFMVALVVTAIALGAVVQAWSATWRRDKEDELIFRAGQYVDAIIAYRKEHGGQFPLTLEDLYKPGPRRLRYIRRLYKEPIAQDGKWGLLYLMPGGQGVYDPRAAQKAQEKAAKDWNSNWETAGTGDLAQPQLPGVTPINQNQYGAGAPGFAGAPPGQFPATPIQGNLPPIPSEQPGTAGTGGLGSPGEKEPVSEPPIGWPIVGVISRATGKFAEDTFKVYKGHERVDEWQFHVFDRGEQVQTPGAPGGPIAPAGMGPGFGNRYPIQGIGGPSGNLWNRGPRPGGPGRNLLPGGGGGQGPQGPPGQYPQGWNSGKPNQGDDSP